MLSRWSHGGHEIVVIIITAMVMMILPNLNVQPLSQDGWIQGCSVFCEIVGKGDKTLLVKRGRAPAFI